MEKATLEFYPNALQLLYIVQGNYGWGKGKTLQEAIKNFKKYNKRVKPTCVNIYALKNEIELEDGLNDITLSYNSITYQSAKVVLLSTSLI